MQCFLLFINVIDFVLLTSVSIPQPRQIQPTGYPRSSGSSSNNNSVLYDSAEAREIVGTMHAEIELLMLSGGYSREVAVRMLLNKVAKERAGGAKSVSRCIFCLLVLSLIIIVLLV